MDVDIAKDAIMSAAIAILEINDAVGNDLPQGYYKDENNANSNAGSNSESKSGSNAGSSMYQLGSTSGSARVPNVSNSSLTAGSNISETGAISANTNRQIPPLSEEPIRSTVRGGVQPPPWQDSRGSPNVNRPIAPPPIRVPARRQQPQESVIAPNGNVQQGGRRAATKKRAPRRRRRTQRAA